MDNNNSGVHTATSEPAAWIYPSDLKRFAKHETTTTVFSVQVGCPEEISVPLYTRPAAFDDLVKALELIADGLEADGRTMDGMTKAAAAKIARAALTKAQS